MNPEASLIALQDYHDDVSGKKPSHYRTNAENAAIETIAKGQDRVLLVMVTGIGKTTAAFQIIRRYRQPFPGSQPSRKQDQVSQRDLHRYSFGADPAQSCPTCAWATAGDSSNNPRDSDEHQRRELVRGRGLASTG